MKGFLKLKLIVSLVTVVLLAGTIALPMVGNIAHAEEPKHEKPTPKPTPPPTPTMLTLTKTATPTPVNPGGTLNYTLTLTNKGPIEARDINLSDILPPGLTAITAITAGPCTKSTVNGQPTVLCTIANLPVNGSVTITFSATVSLGAILIINTATVQSTTTPANATATDTTPVTAYTAAQKKDFSNSATVLGKLGLVETYGSLFACAALGELSGLACSAFFVPLLDAISEQECNAKLNAADPSDPNFTVIAEPVLPTIPQPFAAGGITEREANAMSALVNNQEHANALEDALRTSINRAQGAALAGNTLWEAKQLQTPLFKG